MKVYTTDQMMQRGLPIHIFYQEDAHPHSEHTHDFIEIIYICAGNARQTVNGETFPVTAGDLVFLNFGSTHAFCADQGFAYYNICFAPELTADRLITPENALGLLSLTAFDEMRREKMSGKVHFSGEERRRVEWVFKSMLSEYSQMRPYVSLTLESYMNILMAEILRRTLPASRNGDGDIWKDLFAFIEDHLSQPLTLSALASKCFYNPSYFSRVFKEKYGLSLTEYVTSRRMELARTLLLEQDDMPVAQIAEQCGFPSAGAFYRAFEKANGMTPGDYRKEKSKDFT